MSTLRQRRPFSTRERRRSQRRHAWRFRSVDTRDDANRRRPEGIDAPPDANRWRSESIDAPDDANVGERQCPRRRQRRRSDSGDAPPATSEILRRTTHRFQKRNQLTFGSSRAAESPKYVLSDPPGVPETSLRYFRNPRGVPGTQARYFLQPSGVQEVSTSGFADPGQSRKARCRCFRSTLARAGDVNRGSRRPRTLSADSTLGFTRALPNEGDGEPRVARAAKAVRLTEGPSFPRAAPDEFAMRRRRKGPRPSASESLSLPRRKDAPKLVERLTKSAFSRSADRLADPTRLTEAHGGSRSSTTHRGPRRVQILDGISGPFPTRERRPALSFWNCRSRPMSHPRATVTACSTSKTTR